MFLLKQIQARPENAIMNEIRHQISMVILVVFTVVATIYNTLTISTAVNVSDTDPSFIGYGVALISAIALYMIYRKFYIEIASYLPVIMLLIIYVLLPSEQTFISISFIVLIYTAIVARFPIYISLFIFTLIWSIYQQQTAIGEFPYILIEIVALSMSFVVFYVVNRFQGITGAYVRTNQLLEASSNIAQAINRELDMRQLLDNTVNTIRDEFNYYHVQIFLIDERYEFANLVASTGEAGRQLLARNHRLPVGSQSVIGRVSQVGEAVIAQNTEADKIHALNELLPDTRSELALPIIDAGNVIGALDVQSVNPNAFQKLDIQALQIIANQLAVAIRNARLFEQAEKNIQDNKRLLFQYETNLREVDRLNRTLTKQSWGNYVVQSHINGVTLTEDQLTTQAKWSTTMRNATDSQQPQITVIDDKKIVAIPVMLRGQVLGAIEVEFDADAKVSDSVEMISSVSQRLAISLESARLFEETQEATLQEQQINEIVSSYETAVTIDDLLQLTLKRLQESLGAETGKVRLTTLKSTNLSAPQHNGNGGSPS